MAEQSCLCPVCGRETFVRPARWHQCHYCGSKFLVPSVVRNSLPLAQCLCTVCGDLVTLRPEDDEGDVVCQPCYDLNLREASPGQQPTIAPLAQDLPVRRRALQARDAARWPLTHGQAQEG